MHTVTKVAVGASGAGKGSEVSSDFECSDFGCNMPQSVQGKPGSGLKEIAEILRIPVNAGIAECAMRFPHVHYTMGQRIFTIGQRFDALYVLRTGFLKSAVIDDHGNEQILSFPMRGDLLGADGIHSGRHQSEAVALSDCVLIPLQFGRLLSLGKTVPDFETSLYGLISRELVREHAMIRMLAGLNAETKLARFLVALSQRYAELGYSGKNFVLRMTRRDIGHYLGLSMESVCRTMNAFANLGLIAIEKREIVLQDIAGLNAMRRLQQRRGNSRSA